MTDPSPTRRHFRPTPVWLIYGLLVVEGLLWLSERFQWFAFNHHKGWTVLIGVAVVGVAMILMLGWLIVSLIFRWRFQFSIRSLLVLVVAVAIPSSWLTVEIKAARKQRETIAMLRAAGLKVYYDCELDEDGYRDPRRQLSWPAWWREFMGVDMLATAARVETQPIMIGNFGGFSTFCRQEVGDDQLALLSQLVHLRHLDLSGVPIMTSRLTCLEGLTELESLRLNQHEINDEGLASLAELPNLKKLSIGEGRVTGVALPHLARFKHLEEIQIFAVSLDSPAISDRTLDDLRSALPGCNVSFHMAFREH